MSIYMIVPEYRLRKGTLVIPNKMFEVIAINDKTIPKKPLKIEDMLAIYEQSDVVYPIVKGYFEHVTVLWGGRREDLWCHESGRLPPQQYPRNEIATDIYYAAHVMQGGRREDGFDMVGSVLLITGVHKPE